MIDTANRIKIEALEETQKILERRLENLKNSWRGGKPPWRGSDSAYEEHVAVIEALKNEIHEIDQQIIGIERSERDPEQDAEMRAELYAAMSINGVHDDVSLYMHTPHEEKLFQEQIWRQVQFEDESWPGHDYTGGNCLLCHSFDEDWIFVNGEPVCYQNCAPEVWGFANLLAMFMLPGQVFYNKGSEWEEFGFRDYDPELDND